MGWLAAAQDSDVHLETVEAAKEAGKESDEVRDAGMAGLPKREHP